MREKFNIQGMTCSSCVSHVEKAVKKLNGIKSINVNLLQNMMIVEYNESVINSNIIIEAVQDAGYGASKILENNKKVDTKKEKFIDNSEIINSMKKRLIISIIFWVPLMYVAMYHMFNEWFGIPIPNFIKEYFHGNENRNYFWIYSILIVNTNCLC